MDDNGEVNLISYDATAEGVIQSFLDPYTGGNGSYQKNEENQDNAGHKSLQEYVEQVQKSQRFDFA
ncbi:hypothetical protein GCK32_017828, partial [Trichostrongylus colubriformis]